jgi:hypothetical protein
MEVTCGEVGNTTTHVLKRGTEEDIPYGKSK